LLLRLFILVSVCLYGASCGEVEGPQDAGSTDLDIARSIDTASLSDTASEDVGVPMSDTTSLVDASTQADTAMVDDGSTTGPGDPNDGIATGDTSSAEDVPPPPLEPTSIQANTTWEITAEPLLEGEFTYAWDPSGQELVVQDVDGAVFLSLPGQVSSPLDVAPGGLQSGALVPDGDGEPLLLIAAEEGLFIYFDDALVLSPLDALLPSAPHALLTTGPPVQGWLWIAMAEGLWVFHDGAVYTVQPEGIETTDAAVTFGAPVDGVASLWGVNSSGTWALSPSGDGLTLSATREELTGTAIATDAQSHLWVVDDSGDLHERTPAGGWSWWRLPQAVGRVEAAAQLGGLWLTVGEALWFHYGDGYGPLETVIEGEFLGVDNEGRALVASDGQLWALAINDVTSVIVDDPPTWSVDVEPVFVASCEPCHGKGAYAHPLFESAQWIAEIEQIIFMVTEPAWEPQMPLAPYPPLDNQSVQVIMHWRDAGFPE
jgi:hypothetical protein